MKTIANEYETLEAIKKAMAMYELKKRIKTTLQLRVMLLKTYTA